MTHRIAYNPHLHTSEMFLVMVEALTRDPASLPALDFIPTSHTSTPRFRPRPGELSDFASLRRRDYPRLNSAPLVLLNPNASDLLPLRRWPSDRYLDLARRLLETYPDLFVGFTGSPDEAAEIERLAAAVASHRVISFAGRTTLRQLMLLYMRSELLVTNDSGPAHFASLTPIHVVTLFGPETPALFGARSANTTALWAGLACSPCVNAYNNRQTPCRDNLCMQAITVDQVFAVVTRIFDARRAAEQSHCPDPDVFVRNGMEPLQAGDLDHQPTEAEAILVSGRG